MWKNCETNNNGNKMKSYSTDLRTDVDGVIHLRESQQSDRVLSLFSPF